MKNYLKYIIPPKRWRLPVITLMGIFVGLFVYSFYVSNAVSYISDKPETCINCHIMVPQYTTWRHSSHREVTNCNDCHVPHNNFLNKYYFKGKDGMRHATIFTLRNEPQVIFIKEEGQNVVHQNCIRCHSDKIFDTKLSAQVKEHKMNAESRPCWECHREVPHGRVNSLSSVPNAQIPIESSNTPSWLKD